MGVVLIQLWYNVIKGINMNAKNDSKIPYHRTQYGKMHYMYTHQVASSRQRGMSKPSYTKKEFMAWLIESTNFIEIYKRWENSGYASQLSPSVDRKDDAKSYSFDNIQLMTWGENRAKSHTDRKSGKLKTRQTKSVKQFTKDGVFVKEFYSINQAARELAIASESKISEVCKGLRKSAYGFVWVYAGGVPSE